MYVCIACYPLALLHESGFSIQLLGLLLNQFPLPSSSNLISAWLWKGLSYLPPRRHIPPKFITYVSSRIIFQKGNLIMPLTTQKSSMATRHHGCQTAKHNIPGASYFVLHDISISHLPCTRVSFKSCQTCHGSSNEMSYYPTVPYCQLFLLLTISNFKS